jgi:hypothetical protein
MKISSLLSVSAIVTLAIAETVVEPTLDLDAASDPIVSTITPVITDVISAEDADVEICHGSGRPPSHSSGFTAWSLPGLKGHKQRTKNTPGCYKLDGGAVGSFEGDPKIQYAFYETSTAVKTCCLPPAPPPFGA